MNLSDRIKELTVDAAPESEIEKVAREEGMLDLRESGILQGPRRPDLDRRGRPRFSLRRGEADFRS